MKKISLLAGTSLIFLCCFFCAAYSQQKGATFSQPQDSISKSALLQVNKFQIVDFSPRKAKEGMSGNRFSFWDLIPLFRGSKRGKDGKKGSNGPELFVNISAVLSGDSTILKFIIKQKDSKKGPQVYYVNPRYGHIFIGANGGNGGNGGNGQDGSSDDKKEYRAGDGGNGGNGGEGGTIHVIVDSSARAYGLCTCIAYSNRAGYGGNAGHSGSASFNSGDGNPGNDGEKGVDGPRIFVADSNEKIIGVINNSGSVIPSQKR